MNVAESIAAGNGPSTIPCIVCKGPLTVRLARGRKSGKTFLMLVCGRDGRHLRAFVNDKEFVRRVLDGLEARS